MGCVRPARQGFFPLDEELQLVAGSLTPHVQACLTRLGSWMPFEKAAGTLEDMLQVHISAATTRRQTETWGAGYVAVQEQEAERIERESPPAPAGPGKQLLSADGTMVPLVKGESAEVKTLVLGEIGEPVLEKGEWVVHARQLSYFSRLAEADTFTRLALVETHRRGVETAGQVIAVTDGAEWEQGFIDYHRPDAVRVLDFPHAAGYVAQIGAAIWGADTPTTKKWLTHQLHQLKHEGPSAVLPELRALTEAHPEIPKLAEHLAYLEKREAHMQYPIFQACGWPIGSGSVESSHRLIVGPRLVGAGMHWARVHVSPMLALRNALYNDRWEEACSYIVAHQRQQVEQRRHAHSERHRTTRAAQLPQTAVVAPPTPLEPAPTLPSPQPTLTAEPTPPSAPPSDRPRQPWRPAPDHPWRRFPACTSRPRPGPRAQAAKT